MTQPSPELSQEGLSQEALYEAIDAWRRQADLPWWCVSLKTGRTAAQLRLLAGGAASKATHQDVAAWWARHTASQQRTE
ncbi:hypothetical protein [Streptosporangium longisporum]|uniref:Uncharacterized protein n=1 Tax=Streptosporangium longisporum TaxID=46187 RepID=A0ABP6L4I7_9ACTN